jgi:Ulp1 family protease
MALLKRLLIDVSRYLEENLKEKNPSLSEQTHFFNTFLYERLSRKGDRALNIESVMKWTAKIDLFKKNYIIVPINEA